MKNKKKISILISVVILIGVIGISYAWLTTTILGKKKYVLKAGSLELVLDETSNGLMIENTIPIDDALGLATDPATFSVINRGHSDLCYEIYLDDADLTEDEIRVDDQFVKYSLDRGLQNKGVKRLIDSGKNPNRLIDRFQVASNEKVDYQLRLWFDTEVDGYFENQVFSSKLRIEAVQCKLPIMRAYSEFISTGDIVDEDGFVEYVTDIDYHAKSYREKITSISFKTDTMIPETSIESWDVSEAGDESVIAYAISDGQEGYEVVIGGKNGVIANPDSSSLFFRFYTLKSVDFTNLDTSRVTSMASMVSFCYQLTSINFTNFDTSSVEQMWSFFAFCRSLSEVDLRCFDTSNVINVNWMFSRCNSLVKLDLSSFDTSKMIKMNSMFTECSSLTEILVSNKWVVSEKAETNFMFLNCGTSHVTYL